MDIGGLLPLLSIIATVIGGVLRIERRLMRLELSLKDCPHVNSNGRALEGRKVSV